MSKLNFYGSKIEPYWDHVQTNLKEDSLNKYFKNYLKPNNEEFFVQSGFGNGRFELQVELKSESKSFYYPVQLVQFSEIKKEDYSNSADFCWDYILSYWNEYFSNERDVYLPIDWSLTKYNGIEFFIRGSFRNLNLENLADKLLNDHGFGDYEILPITMDT